MRPTVIRTAALLCAQSNYAPLVLASLLVATTGQLIAQVHYQGDQPWSQRADSGPDAEVPGWYYNLGLTGIRAELVANEPKALLVKHVLKKSLARNAIKVDDLLYEGQYLDMSQIAAARRFHCNQEVKKSEEIL